MQETIKRVETRVREILTGESTGHDWYHIKQVRDMALRIAKEEGGDTEIIELAALAHDVGDRKFFASKEEGQAATRDVLVNAGVSTEAVEKIMCIIDTMSFSTGMVPDSLEGKIVQDADRLYALGAIGIARACAYGASKGRLIYDPEISPVLNMTKEEYKKSTSPTINHFYEKLLLLKDSMNTKTGRKIAEGRHAFMEQFLDRFFKEWDAKDV